MRDNLLLSSALTYLSLPFSKGESEGISNEPPLLSNCLKRGQILFFQPKGIF